ncbi:peptidase S8, partial [Mesorhizobium sp. M1D.F.Ca.ET.231.01.1.1]
AAGADCAKDDGGGTPGAGPAGAVFLPALIVDLFPNPPGGATPVPTPDPRRDPASSLPPPAQPAPPVQAPALGGPIISPTDLIATEPQRAIVGD